MRQYTVLTAETKQGRLGIEDVMLHSYSADIDSVPPRWARVLTVDEVPVSYILVDPNRRMGFPAGDLRYAFLCDVATRSDRRREGYFRRIVHDTLASLRAAGLPLVLTHGHCQLYRQFGFDVFTHHCGVFLRPELVEARLGPGAPDGAEQLLVVDQDRRVQEDLLLVADVKVTAFPTAKAALQSSARLARELGKSRILFEHPAASVHGSRYPVCPSLETPLAILARACGGSVRVEGSDPEGRSIEHADWIKVLDAPALARQVLPLLGQPDGLPYAGIGIHTEAGAVNVQSSPDGLRLLDSAEPGAEVLTWPAAALAQLVTGYQPVRALLAVHSTTLRAVETDLLEALFPPRWRLSRNESWTYSS